MLRSKNLHRKRRGLSRIVAVVIYRQEQVESKLKESLRDKLPAYMIPSEIHFAESLPFNQNGKLDRKLLIQQIFMESKN